MTTVTVSQITPRPSHSPVKLLMTRRHSKPTSDSSAPLTSSSRSQVEVRSEVRVKPLVFAPPSSASEGGFRSLFARDWPGAPVKSRRRVRPGSARPPGDRAARDHMIQANLRLVVRIARDFETFGLPLLDLISEGNIGLMTAVDRFDPMRGGAPRLMPRSGSSNTCAGPSPITHAPSACRCTSAKNSFASIVPRPG